MEQKYARCGDCKRPLRLGPTPNWGGRIAWSEAVVDGKTVHYCFGCTRAKAESIYDISPPRVGRPRSIAV